ncbi:PhoX family protein [Cupriavidus sp. IDO]|uniref:PhoX family protein n=1 Tax=Cupriavidus sp. IDO TaxID=1539142 RepID=UPI00057911A0|nr:alkaline phosphatase PhoX [Cupriavidus sp. IDO]KWR79460.1 alkaline phosphatase [Cupriavidus sp. IDO]
MLEKPDAARRKALRIIAGAPLLPLGLASAGLLAGGCGGSDDAVAAPVPAPNPGPSASATFTTAEFTGMSAPTLADPAAMATTTVGSSLKVSFSDGSSQTYKLAYQPFFMTGDTLPDGKGGTVVAGGYYNINNQPIIDTSVAGKERQFFSDAPDGSSLLTLANPTVPGVKGNTVFAVVQFEYTSVNQNKVSMYGLLPSPIAVVTLDQDPATGKLTPVKYHNVDTSGVNGLWITCGASLSPWNTHLSSEEYETDLKTASAVTQLQNYSQNLYGDPNKANAYNYGHLPEVTVNPDGTGSIKKHYCLGRISHELVQVMPDERTVLMGDDATNGGLFLFIADQARDLSSGTLYVAKWTQVSGVGPGSATLSWIKLGHATSAEIRALVDGGIRLADMMDVQTGDPFDSSYTRILYNGKPNWIKLVPGMEKAAAFLETHRYAAFVGGSLGFTKMEGTTVNIKDKKAYSAMSRIEASMLRGNAANAGDIQVEGPYSGAVYELNLKGGQSDKGGAAISSEWVPVDMAAVPALVSEDLGGGKMLQQDALGNFANPDKIATPDNLKFSEKLRTLFIGEDSNTHVNNFLWAYNVDTKVLSRVLSCPAGAESTGLHAVDEINGWTYVMSNFQHVGDWESPLHDKVKPTLDPLVRASYKDKFGSSVGYLTADPTSVKLAKA